MCGCESETTRCVSSASQECTRRLVKFEGRGPQEVDRGGPGGSCGLRGDVLLGHISHRVPGLPPQVVHHNLLAHAAKGLDRDGDVSWRGRWSLFAGKPNRRGADCRSTGKAVERLDTVEARLLRLGLDHIEKLRELHDCERAASRS